MGGYIGGRLAIVLPVRFVRAVVIVIGTVVTIASAGHYWLP